jgi:isoamyl acetate esterase
MKKIKFLGAITTFILSVYVVYYFFPQKYDVVAFGDSNTEGANWEERGYDESKKWVNLLKKDGVDIYNAGVGGESSEDARKRFERDVIRRDPKVVFIMLGTNDATMEENGKPKVSKENFKENIEYFIEKIQKQGGKVVLMTCLPIIEGNGNDGLYYSRHDKKLYKKYRGARKWHDSYNQIIREIAEQHNLVLIDNWKKFVELAEGANDEKLIKSGLIDSSGTHLSPKGALVIYQSIKDSGVLDLNKNGE